jgi:hypothetical protein
VAAALASLGCGNPTALAELSPEERMLDLGSGGIDVLLSARRYALQEIAESGAHASLSTHGEAERKDVDGKFVSAFMRALKPVGI